MNTILSLFQQKSWANHELFNALAEVDAVQDAQTVQAAIRTLNHIFVVDEIFRAHLLGVAHGHLATNTEATPELGALQFSVAELDAWFMDYAAGVSDQQLSERIAFSFTDGDTGTMTREEMLLHVITHGAYHRGNVGQMLKSIAIAPPRDLYTKFLHITQTERRWA